VSDDEIQDLFQSAEEWSPDSNAAVGTGAGANPDPAADPSGPGAPAGQNAQPTTGTGANSLPPLQRGSDVEIAEAVAQVLRQDRGEVIFCEGHFWYYVGSHWRPIEDHVLRREVHRYDGALVPGARSPVPVKLNKPRVDSILNEMGAILARPNFFADAPVGINCVSGFIAFAADGTPSVLPHHADHRCRHVLNASFTDPLVLDAEDIFALNKICGGLLGRLLDGVFLDDPDAQEKRQLLAEIAGAAALGYGTKLRQPKAVILEGKTAENGKSQVLDLFRGLLPADAVASIPAAKMGDERFVVGLVGKHLNASDELSGAEAIASDFFKAVVTGEPVTGRDVYRSAVTFRSLAQNVFATNTLPSFKGGMDRGVKRRLLVITFERTIPEEERIENIGLRIAQEEADVLLTWAVAGASRLIRQRGFTVPPSSKIALREWLLSADPVLAWIETCTEVVDPNSPDWEKASIKSKKAHAAFVSWATSEGFRENMLPAISGFVQRLRANRPSIKVKHERVGNFLKGIRIISGEGEADVTELFSGRTQ
jgi:P4 family phage/plasmid primase-like protien